MKPATMWAVTGEWTDGRRFLYAGTWLTRTDAIYEHTGPKRTWAECRRNGDRAVKVRVTVLTPNKREADK